MIRPRECDETDEVLMADAASGDDSAFGQLAARHRPWLLEYFRRQTRCYETAEDLAQITLLRAFTARRRWKHAARVTTWLMCIAKRLAMNHHRDSRRGLSRAEGAVLSTVIDHREQEPLQAALARESSLLLRTAVRGLTPHQREAVLLFYFCELPGPEVSRCLHCTHTAVRCLLTRARNELKERLVAGG